MPGPWGVELSLHHLSLAQTWLFLQEGVDQSANQGTSSPQFSRGCSGREEEEKQCFREAAGRAAHPYCPWHSRTKHHLQLLISRNLCLLNQTDQKFLCFHLFSFLPVGDSTLSSSAGFVLPCSWLGFGSGLSLARAVRFPLCQDSG